MNSSASMQRERSPTAEATATDDELSPLPEKADSQLRIMRKSQSTPAFDQVSPRSPGSTGPSQVSIEIKDKRLGSNSMPLALVTASENKPKPPAIISWKGLVVALRSINKTLLKGISGQITTGYWAIMG